ncbi:hypothetical protein LOZ12_004531 [Ophidiomyces ophidiicola]|uniref:Uncharacterized protein n=1 Tax=Ophidiomyces ophidiicola TaxID=1387563 RepID=A0ACB8V3L8_9EURO|nr:hypothetical protein LOZ64_004799 [Ophidiomyces ophidiicola]KAI1954725.1 hypothetical protein LOZ62_000740 [Ophidiomyces ophidiicola]KAI1973445.1 hypothetical protein LOZ56_001883 [Ophidiomyces ophidiicola]KAI2007625.1 hypothetical protein LOZ50_002501 [Ophidiomyces ophidiicola]KAI2027749.1 hypothetical protein LOZ45_002532 [Ophidiomyces ophidiicola]
MGTKQAAIHATFRLPDPDDVSTLLPTSPLARRPALNALDTAVPAPARPPPHALRPACLQLSPAATAATVPSLRAASPFDIRRHEPAPVSPASKTDRSASRAATPVSPSARQLPALSPINVHSRHFAPFRHDRSPLQTPLSPRCPHPYPPPELHFDTPLRSSLHSATTGSTSLEPASETERSSILTNPSSVADLSPDAGDTGMSVDDAIDMYLDGFSDDSSSGTSPDSPDPEKSLPAADLQSISRYPKSSLKVAELGPNALVSPSNKTTSPTNAPISLPKSQLQPKLVVDTGSADKEQRTSPLSSPSGNLPGNVEKRMTVPEVLSVGVPPPLSIDTDLRDIYGFKKQTTHITVRQFKAWNDPYLRYVDYRRRKWVEMVGSAHPEHPDTLPFPSRSNKMKRYIRKGIPPEYRGSAWFWYAGGPEYLLKSPGLYRKLVEQAFQAPMNDDKEHIERDLHRTFPDNVHYKPDDSSASQPFEGSSNLNHLSDTPETPIIQSLRRVLYAFSIHNSKIGYTQSLNFIAGLLLLFLPEEKSFWMLHIITSTFLPGTHEVSLEGANADLWILMVALKESLPAVYTKVASPTPTTARSRPPTITTTTRLPDITLGLTNWLMSMFIGSLPLETTLRVWDILFYEGSRTFFRVALAIFRISQRDILSVSDPMEIFQIVQTAPKRMLDASALADDCFMRRFRFSQARIDSLRVARRQAIREDKERASFLARPGHFRNDADTRPGTSSPPSPGQWRAWKKFQ